MDSKARQQVGELVDEPVELAEPHQSSLVTPG